MLVCLAYYSCRLNVQYKYPDTTIIVFCKAPVAGQVKTRLMPELDAQQAADIHTELSNQTLSLLHKAKLCPVQLWCSPDINHDFFNQCVDSFGVSLHLQQGNDLGERMHHAMSNALEIFSSVLLIGCDCPSFEHHDFELAIAELEKNDIIIAPAEDGGYVMIGLKRSLPSLFLNMTWSHGNVYRNTLKQLDKLDLKFYESRKQWDVDTYNDLQRFHAEKYNITGI